MSYEDHPDSTEADVMLPLWLTIARWILLAPAVLLGGTLIFELADFIIEVSNTDPGSFLTILFGDLIAPAAWGAGVVWLACEVAPTAKPVVAGIVAGLVIAVGVWGLSVVLGVEEFGVTQIKAIAIVLSSVAAAIYVAVRAYQDDLDLGLDEWLKDRFGYQ